MSIRINDVVPDFTVDSTAVAQLSPEFAKRKTKVMGASADNVEEHKKRKSVIEAFAGGPTDFPIINDTSLQVSKLYDLLPADAYLSARASIAIGCYWTRARSLVDVRQSVLSTGVYREFRRPLAESRET